MACNTQLPGLVRLCCADRATGASVFLERDLQQLPAFTCRMNTVMQRPPRCFALIMNAEGDLLRIIPHVQRFDAQGLINRYQDLYRIVFATTLSLGIQDGCVLSTRSPKC